MATHPTRRRRVMVVVLIALAVVVGSSCTELDDTPIEPLSGHSPLDPAVADAEPLREPVALADLPEDMYVDTVPGFGERPFEELDLPPDEPPPPIEGGSSAAPPAQPAAPAPAPASPPPPANAAPRPVGSAGSLDSTTTYCALVERYGDVLVVVDDAMAGGSPDAISSALQLAASAYSRGAEIGPPDRRADHERVAAAMSQLDSVLADFGYDFGAMLEGADADPAVAARLATAQSTETEQAIVRVDQYASSACGFSFG